jgi:dihydroorotate dehydrogenase (fumarate)
MGAGTRPVIGSLNGVSPTGWLQYARLIEEAGASALELNVYRVPTDPRTSASELESRLFGIVWQVKGAVSIPLAVKLSPFFSSLPHLARALDDFGVDGLVLFNRFYQPDIDIDALEVAPQLHLSDSSELLLRLRWLAILSGRLRASLAASGGIHTAQDAIKAIMVGAHAVQLVSALLRHGPARLQTIRQEVATWLAEHDYESLDQMRGSMDLTRCPDPAALERAHYVRILQSWRPTAAD